MTIRTKTSTRAVVDAIGALISFYSILLLVGASAGVLTTIIDRMIHRARGLKSVKVIPPCMYPRVALAQYRKNILVPLLTRQKIQLINEAVKDYGLPIHTVNAHIQMSGFNL